MQTKTYEIADRIFRLSTCVPYAAPGGFTFNQCRLADGEVIDLGGKQIRHIDTPHVLHNWEARVHGSSTRTRCGDALLGLADAYGSLAR
jgi:hypothetical protein